MTESDTLAMLAYSQHRSWARGPDEVAPRKWKFPFRNQGPALCARTPVRDGHNWRTTLFERLTEQDLLRVTAHSRPVLFFSKSKDTCICGETVTQRPNFDGLWFDILGGVAGGDGHPHAPAEFWTTPEPTGAVKAWLDALEGALLESGDENTQT